VFAECRRILPEIPSNRIMGAQFPSQWLNSLVTSAPPFPILTSGIILRGGGRIFVRTRNPF
jgi:hypothetical protein